METRLTIAPEGWGDEAAALLETAARDELVGVETIRLLVSNGAQLFVSRLDGKAVFAHVVWVNSCERGLEAVVAASAGVAMSGRLLSKIMIADIERRFAHCARIRITASRPGMERILEGLGYERQAVTYIKRCQ